MMIKKGAGNGQSGKRKRLTMTKVLVPALLIVGIIGGFMPYILAWRGMETAESMGIAWVSEVVATILGYLCKSYFESKQEGIQAVEEHKAGMDDAGKDTKDYTASISKGGSG